MAKNIVHAFKLRLKRLALRRKGVIIHNNVVFSGVVFRGSATVEPYCRIIGVPQITVGNNFYLNTHCHILGEITIGDNVQIGPKVVIWGQDHGINKDQLICEQVRVSLPITIGDDVWIGTHAMILKGISIGKGVVVGAGSVVTKNIPDYAIVVGNPARIVKYRE